MSFQSENNPPTDITHNFTSKSKSKCFSDQSKNLPNKVTSPELHIPNNPENTEYSNTLSCYDLNTLTNTPQNTLQLNNLKNMQSYLTTSIRLTLDSLLL